MDGVRFDRWTKCFASGVTRRQLVKVLIGGGTAALLGERGLNDAEAATCRGAGRTCSKPAQCCSGICGDGPNRRKVCLCPPGSVPCGDGCIPEGACCIASDCPPPPVCHKATCDAGVCGTTLTAGRRCDDGDACTVHDTCQSDGRCQGTPKDCSALTDACNDGVCDPATGRCVAVVAREGESCPGDDACLQTFTCRKGQCVGSDPVVCDNGDQCHDAGTCDPATGECGPPVPKRDGTRCSDDNACTDTDTCQGGVCTPGTAVVCQPLDQCHAAGVCDPATGECSNPIAADGAHCSGDNPCFSDYFCDKGDCISTTRKNCSTFSECHNAACDPTSGECVEIPVDNGTFCGDLTSCVDRQCLDGQCTVVVDCLPPYVCVDRQRCCLPDTSTCDFNTECCSGICEPITGTCLCRTLGNFCNVDINCCGAIQPACCDGVCRDLDSDPFHCGACNNPIPFGAICVQGSPVCLTVDADGLPGVCDDRCVEMATDLEHCGTCHHACAVGTEVCSHGHCCPVGQEWVGTRCCPIGFHADKGVCCAAGLSNCGGTCVRLDVDLNHCGQCNRKAPAGGVCLGGQPQCTPGLTNDNGVCCPAGMHNSGGICCFNGGLTTNCGGRCVDTDSDPLNCGSCGRGCDIGHPFCVDGKCCSIIGQCI